MMAYMAIGSHQRKNGGAGFTLDVVTIGWDPRVRPLRSDLIEPSISVDSKP